MQTYTDYTCQDNVFISISTDISHKTLDIKISPQQSRLVSLHNVIKKIANYPSFVSIQLIDFQTCILFPCGNVSSTVCIELSGDSSAAHCIISQLYRQTDVRCPRRVRDHPAGSSGCQPALTSN